MVKIINLIAYLAMLLLFATGCGTTPTYSVYTSDNGEKWSPIIERATRKTVDAQIKSSCRLRLWGTDSHSVRVVHEKSGNDEIYLCDEVIEQQKNIPRQPPQENSKPKNTIKLW